MEAGKEETPRSRTRGDTYKQERRRHMEAGHEVTHTSRKGADTYKQDTR